jgi:hypothetical protein
MKRVTVSGVAAVAVGLLVACSGTNNTTPSAPTPTPTPTPTVTVSSLTITSAPASSTTFQLTATARMSDTTTRDVTTLAAWETSNAALATVSPTGVLTVVGSGEIEARATYQGVMGTVKMVVTPSPGPSFVLSGVVREVAPAAKLVSGVRVSITAGPNAGRFVVTDSSGQFGFTQVSAAVIAMEATKDGYELWRVTNLDMDRDRSLDVTLYPDPPSNAAGAVATARCNDGTWSWASVRSDACTANGGIAYGVCPGSLCDGRLEPSVTFR